jgi:hypothetical protein
VRFVDGGPGAPCGGALSFGAPNNSAFDGGYGVLPDDPRWHLAVGSVELWVKIPPAWGQLYVGILSRDATGQRQGGHFGIYYAGSSDDGGLSGVTARLQPYSPDGGVPSQFACHKQPLADGQWHHVGVNFGGPAGLELFVDGKRVAINSASNDRCSVARVPLTIGIDDNNNPWVIGADTSASAEGLATRVRRYFVGTIDELRISNLRRDFGVARDQ